MLKQKERGVKLMMFFFLFNGIGVKEGVVEFEYLFV